MQSSFNKSVAQVEVLVTKGYFGPSGALVFGLLFLSIFLVGAIFGSDPYWRSSAPWLVGIAMISCFHLAWATTVRSATAYVSVGILAGLLMYAGLAHFLRSRSVLDALIGLWMAYQLAIYLTVFHRRFRRRVGNESVSQA
ncbi:MAG: hypothetical protein I8H94_02200 [Rhodobacteraceae bacterium]|nr:hypothetical protein [Paracoccaceae bacterium]